MTQTVPKRILPAIVFSQFAGTSLWFAGNAVISQLTFDGLEAEGAVADITSAVMFGFIIGTFTFALLSIADRFKPSYVFLASAILGAGANLAVIAYPQSYLAWIICRALTGFFLAGIYPVGMKIASDWYKGGLGKALGYLVGALVLGTAFPHLLKYLGDQLSWEDVLLGTSLLAIAGGVVMFSLVGEGPNRKKGASFQPKKIIEVFKKPDFRAAAFGYFGHMWELYTFWAFVPVMLSYYNQQNSDATAFDTSLWTFNIIAIGAVACVIGGIRSAKKGSGRVAFGFLLVSGIMCLISPLLFALPPALFLAGLVIWGFAVIGDSAQFSSLNAQTAPPEFVGTALTIAVSIGFLLTIPSIQLISYLDGKIAFEWLMLTLVIGPVFGLINTRKLLAK